MKLFARRTLAFLFWSPVLFGAAGCNNQGEGERCDRTNGNTDCDQGLICTNSVYVAGVYHQICCPVPPARITVQVCNTAGNPRPDAGTGTPDATSDGRAESGADASGNDTSGNDASGNDATSEPSGDRGTIDTTTEVSRDMSADPSMPDISADGATNDVADAVDAPVDLPSTTDQTSPDAPDGSPVDALPDTAPDAPNDAPPDTPDLDVMTPIDVGDVGDVGDAPAEGGPG